MLLARCLVSLAAVPCPLSRAWGGSHQQATVVLHRSLLGASCRRRTQTAAVRGRTPPIPPETILPYPSSQDTHTARCLATPPPGRPPLVDSAKLPHPNRQSSRRRIDRSVHLFASR